MQDARKPQRKRQATPEPTAVEPSPTKRWERPPPREPNPYTPEPRKPMPWQWEDIHPPITAETLQELTGVHITTCRRWMRGRPPLMVVRLVCLVMGGDLGVMNAAWRGWRMSKTGQLVSPERWTFTPGNVMSLVFVRAQVRSLQERVKFSVQADFIEQQWVEPAHTTMTDEQIELRNRANGTQQTLSPATQASLALSERPATRRRAGGAR